MQTRSSNWLALGKLYLFFFYFSGVYQLCILMSGSAGTVGLRQALYMSFMWLVPPLIWPRYTRIFTAVSGLLLWLISLLSLGYFAIYHQEFSQSVIFVLFESNPVEGSEFIKQYYQWWMIPAAIIYAMPPLLLWFRLEEIQIAPMRAGSVVGLSLALSVVGPFMSPVLKGDGWKVGINHLVKCMEPATPWQLVMGYVQYRQQMSEMNSLLQQNRQLPPLQNFRDASPIRKTTLVLVIGESTNAQRMGLYGYNRDTTPQLDSIREQLFVFSNVFSPRPYTIESLQQVLTFADQRNPDLYLTRPSILNMMKQAGYKTYWITNQQTLTQRNTMLTTFSRQADEQIYLNNNRRQNASQHDEVVIDPFKKILMNTEEKKFIVIHLLGTHMKYNYRYPESFAHFSDRNGVPEWLSDEQADLYNSYDNAIRYNDHVLYQLIQTLSDRDNYSFLLYLSDHGEEVYDDKQKNFAGRNEASPEKTMYSVPFILWTSQEWQRENDVATFKNFTQRPYSTSETIYTWAELSGLSFDGMDVRRSIVSKTFSYPEVLIGDPYHPKGLCNVRDLNWID